MTILCDLAEKYGTDRHPKSKHSYTPFYYDLFKDRRKSVKKILEIGVGEGPGLRMWRDFFPNAMIYGADNDPDRIFKDGRIEVFQCDQSNFRHLTQLVRKIGSDLDFVVEDGSHDPCHQIFTCLFLMSLLKKDVIYIIEDVKTFFVDIICGSLGEYKYYIPELQRARGSRNDNRLIVVRHKNGN